MKQIFIIHSGNEPPRTVVVTGKRTNMFLNEMIVAGNAGITSIAYPGVRVADAIFKLRGKGFVIETQYESHEGPFQGVHGRYKLKSRVEPVVDTVAKISEPTTVASAVAGAQ